MSRKLVRISLVIWMALMPLATILAQGEALARGQDMTAAKAVLQRVETGQRIELPVEIQVHNLDNDGYLASYQHTCSTAVPHAG